MQPETPDILTGLATHFIQDNYYRSSIMEHDKLPWKRCRVAGGWDGIKSADGSILFNVALNNLANSDLIIKACNHHKDLLDLARNIAYGVDVNVDSVINLIEEIDAN